MSPISSTITLTPTTSKISTPTSFISEKLGKIEYSPHEVLHFEKGLFGFPDHRRFLLITNNQMSLFIYLQSLEKDITFILTRAKLFFKDYRVKTHRQEQDKHPDEIDFNIATVSNDGTASMSLNLLGPLLIDINKHTGRQAVVENTLYTTKHPIDNHKLTALILQGYSLVEDMKMQISNSKKIF